MTISRLRWLAVMVVVAIAAIATPARSVAETVIIVTEGTTQKTFTLATLPSSFNLDNFTNIKITVNPSTVGAGHTLSTTLNALPSSGFNPAVGLEVKVVSDFVNPFSDGSGEFAGNVSNTSAFAATTNTGTARLFYSDAIGTVSFNLPAVSVSTPQTSPPQSGGFAPRTVAGVPSAFSIEQVINFQVGALVDPSASFTAGISNEILFAPPPSAVPAPPAAVLALTALPLLGLRRWMRNKTA
jgi:hypothetical protein